MRLAPGRRLPRAVVVLAPCLFLVLAGTGPFEGCGGAHEEPRPLPVDSASACFFDTDCEPVACEALRCIGGVCTEIAPLRDGDGDGFALAPCGERFDCDDADPAIHPDARELCDLVDQDCDAAIDEGADPRAIRFDLGTIDPAMTMVAWGDHLLVTDAAFSMRRVNVRHVALDGTISVTETLLETTSRGFAADASATPDGALFAIAVEDPATGAQEIVLIRARRGVDDVVEVVGEPIRHPVEDLEDVALTVIGDVPVLAWDAGSTRFLWSPGWTGEPREIASGLVEGLASLDLASDGANAVIATGRGMLSFFDPADGSTVGTRATTGELAVGQPLADRDGELVAIVRDAYDHSVQQVGLDRAGPLDSIPTGGALALRIDVVSAGWLLLRRETPGVRGWLLDPAAPDVPLETFGPTELSGRGGVLDTEVVELPAGTAILSNFGAAGSSLAVLACGEGR